MGTKKHKVKQQMLSNDHRSLRQHPRHGLHLKGPNSYNFKHRQNYETLALRQGKIFALVPLVR